MKQKYAVRELAFLSACQTSAGKEKLSLEAVHLAGGMLAAGYRSGGKYAVDRGSVRPYCSENFLQGTYGKVKGFGNPGIDSRRTAYAFHNALKSVRETPVGVLRKVLISAG